MAKGALLVALAFSYLAMFYLVRSVEANVGTDGAVEEDIERVKQGLKTDDEVVEREARANSPDGFNSEELKVIREKGKKYEFQAEVNKLMKIIINSLYSNTDIFLRELISNSSDALDKIRFISLTDPTALGTASHLSIKITANADSKTLTITDTGIGMTRDELVNNLGTIARSGTTHFVEEMTKGGDLSLIGQFGVGFYSAFLVADRITVASKSNNDEKQWVWESSSDTEFTIAEDPRGNTLGRGTAITLHLKADNENLLENEVLRKLVHTYSEFIDFPIYLWSASDIERPIQKEADEEPKAEKAEGEESVDVQEDSEEPADEDDTEIVTVWDWELVNDTKPIWTRDRKEITEEEYNSFYKAISRSPEPPLAYTHFNAEGEVNFKSILFVPFTAPSGMFDAKFTETSKDLRLYVRRVFITDDLSVVIPKYLTFIKGVIDSADLPLNVSREILQQNKLLGMIKKKIVRKCLTMFQDLAESNDEKYKDFWQQYGVNIKLGMLDDQPNRSRLEKLLRFYSSKTDSNTSFDDYISRMKSGQKDIYYIGGEDREELLNSPLLERLIKRNYEVLFMTEPIDEYLFQSYTKYGDYTITNIAKDGLKLPEDEEKEDDKKAQEETFKKLTDFLKNHLGAKIDRAVVSTRLTSSPSALVTSAWGWTANMERLARAQALGDKNSNAAYKARKIMEINPRHPIVIELNKRLQEESSEQSAILGDAAELLYDTAALTSGFSLENPSAFAKRVNTVLKMSLSIDPNAEPEPEPEYVEPEKKEQQNEDKSQEEEEEEEHQHSDHDDDDDHDSKPKTRKTKEDL